MDLKGEIYISFILFVSYFQSAASLTNFLRSGFPFPPSSGTQEYSEDMKVPPIQLPTGMDRLPLPLPFSPDLLWRYPNPFMAQPPPSPLESHVKSGLPGRKIPNVNEQEAHYGGYYSSIFCLFFTHTQGSLCDKLMMGGSGHLKIIVKERK